jgi:signal peptidase
MIAARRTTNDTREQTHPTVRLLRRGARRLTSAVALVAIAAATATIAVVVYGALTQSWRIVPVRSGSMTPTAPKGSAVVAEPQRATDLRVGDVVLFHAPTAQHPLVVHRIHEIVVRDGERLYRTKGDANRAPDPWLIRMRADTVWRVHHVVPVVGNVVDAADQPYVRFGGLALAVGAIAWLGLARIWRRERMSADALGARGSANAASRAAMAAQAAAIAAASVSSTTSAGPEGDDAGAGASTTHASTA